MHLTIMASYKENISMLKKNFGNGMHLTIMASYKENISMLLSLHTTQNNDASYKELGFNEYH